MDLGLQDKVVFITGGSKGIGKACGLEFAREGARVALCARGEDGLRAAAAEITAATGREVFTVAGDMTKWEDARRCVDAAAAHYGGLDILVNCAGASPGGLILNLTEDDWALSMQLKFMGYVRCAKAAIPHLLRRGGGRIVNVVGNDGIKPAYWELTASAANAADLAVTSALAEQYGPHGILVNAVNPGPVATERWDGLVRAYARDKGLSIEEANRKALASLPLGRICTPQEVAWVVVFVASARASYMNGAWITLDGGQRKAIMDI
ncbi:MAG: SDR family oxidoreductase [Armatimonadota bacterium]|nr:SDR family oxidoreductase [Armatimonadota bacterium]